MVLWVIIWGSHCINVFEAWFSDRRNTSTKDFDRRVILSVLWLVDFNRHLGHEDHNNNIHEGTRMESEHKSSISWTYMYYVDVKKAPFSPSFSRVFAYVSIGKSHSAECDVIWIVRGNSIIVEWSRFACGSSQPSTASWFLRFPPEYMWQQRKWKIWSIEILSLNISC